MKSDTEPLGEPSISLPRPQGLWVWSPLHAYCRQHEPTNTFRVQRSSSASPGTRSRLRSIAGTLSITARALCGMLASSIYLRTSFLSLHVPWIHARQCSHFGYVIYFIYFKDLVKLSEEGHWKARVLLSAQSDFFLSDAPPIFSGARPPAYPWTFEPDSRDRKNFVLESPSYHPSILVWLDWWYRRVHHLWQLWGWGQSTRGDVSWPDRSCVKTSVPVTCQYRHHPPRTQSASRLVALPAGSPERRRSSWRDRLSCTFNCSSSSKASVWSEAWSQQWDSVYRKHCGV